MMQEWARDSRFKTLVMVVLVLVGAALAAYTYSAYEQGKQIDKGAYTIAVSGKGEEFIKPDIATFGFSVVAEEKEAMGAQKKSADAINAITAYLKGQGIDEKDIKTEGYNLYPRKEYSNSVCPPFGMCPPGKETLVGYTVDQRISVKVRKTDTAGELIAGVTTKGATNVSDLTFTIDNIDKARESIRAEAIKDAREQAGRLAQNLGVRLGRLVNYSENGSQPPIMYGGGYAMANQAKIMDSRAMPESAPQVPVGENRITEMVTLYYEIK